MLKQGQGKCRCGSVWSGLTRAHCGVCHELFSTVGNFDSHRVSGECVDPTTKNMYNNGYMWRKNAAPV